MQFEINWNIITNENYSEQLFIRVMFNNIYKLIRLFKRR
jgi:hypothetical protein